MKDSIKRMVKSTQEQAVASGITALNQKRLNELLENLNQQDINIETALIELGKLKEFIGDPSKILGSHLTKHGEIAENMQVYISNARRAVEGLEKNHTFDDVGRTAVEDYLRDGQAVQSKFYNGLNNTLFGKNALSDHLNKNKDFITNGGSYDIPKDQYEKMIELLDKYKDNPKELSGSEYRLAEKINDFLEKNDLELGENIKPAVVTYSDSQQGNASQVVEKEEKNIKEEDKKQRERAYKKSKPSFKEGAKATAISAIAEGGINFCISFVGKRKEKKLSEFTSDDWKEIGIDTRDGAIKGGIRGGSIYILTNFTATPANVASAYVTAGFGISQQLKELEKGNVSKEDFVIECEAICLDVTVSTIAAIAGEILIPIPILGAVIGSVAGEYIKKWCNKLGDERSKKIIENYNNEMNQLNKKLDLQLLEVILEIRKELDKYDDLEKLAFNEDVNIAFKGSINLAKEIGVSSKEILKTKNDIDDYFLV